MKTLEEYKAFVAELKKLTGLDAMIPDGDGLVTLRVDDKYNVNLQYIEGMGKVLCFIEMMVLPKDAPRDVYRDLLIAGLFGRDTAGGYFALEDESEILVYNYFFDGDMIAKEPEEFISTLEKILSLCDIWVDRISGNLSGDVDADDNTPVNFDNIVYP